MKYLAVVLFFLSCTSLSAIGKDKSEVKDWEWRGAGESGAWLHTEKLGTNIQFNLELNRGAPSYNSGVISGEFLIEHHLGFYQPRELPKCTLIFAFVGDTVEIKQLGSDSDCGFGFGVMASHVLTLKKHSN